MSSSLYRKELNDLSQRIRDIISDFTILLHNAGDDFAQNGVGCGSSVCEKRTHRINDWPEIEEIFERIVYKKEHQCNYLKVASEL